MGYDQGKMKEMGSIAVLEIKGHRCWERASALSHFLAFSFKTFTKTCHFLPWEVMFIGSLQQAQ
jgi:hypothetical protein